MSTLPTKESSRKAPSLERVALVTAFGLLAGYLALAWTILRKEPRRSTP